MPHYYFHLHEQAGTVKDPEGRALENAASARDHAVIAARSIMSENVLTGFLDLSDYVEITDELGDLVLVVSFEEAVTCIM